MGNELIGSYAVVRCTQAGVHAGVVRSVDGPQVVLTESRRLWEWQCARSISLSGVAQYGLDYGKSRIAPEVGTILVGDMCEVIECSPAGEQSIRGAPEG